MGSLVITAAEQYTVQQYKLFQSLVSEKHRFLELVKITDTIIILSRNTPQAGAAVPDKASGMSPLPTIPLLLAWHFAINILYSYPIFGGLI